MTMQNCLQAAYSVDYYSSGSWERKALFLMMSIISHKISKILRNTTIQLFFQTLNTPVYARKNSDLNTPYLNGGLFDAHNNDWQFEETSFPATYFTDLFNHLNKYNFTTDESSPDYEQVAIDPEMLGRVLSRF